MFIEGNQIHNFMSNSGSGTVINYGSVSGSDFLTSYGSGSGSISQKVTVPTIPVPVPQHCPQLCITFANWFNHAKKHYWHIYVVSLLSAFLEDTCQQLILFKAYVYQRLGETGRILSPVTVEQSSLVYDPSVPPPSYHPPYNHNTFLQQVDSRFIQGKPRMAFFAEIHLVIQFSLLEIFES